MEVVCPPEDGHPSQYQLTDSAAVGDRTHDHCVASPTPLTTRLPSYQDISESVRHKSAIRCGDHGSMR